MLNKGKVDMLNGPVFKGLLSLTIPIMIMNVVQNMFNLIDMMVLGKFTNDTAVGAVGICSVLISLCTGLFIGIATGANVVVAKSIGVGNKSRTEKTIGTAVLLSVFCGILLATIGVYFADNFLKMINCPQSILKDATLYFKLYFLGTPMLILYNFCAGILRAGGDTKRPMYFLITGGVVKVVLNYFCITVLDMTVAGVGIATIVSNLVMGGLTFYAVLTNQNGTKFNWNRLRIYPKELYEILFIGVPAGLQTAMYSLANTVIVTAVNSFGPDATTGVSIANQFDAILYYISCAASVAVMPYFAQNIGARKFERSKKIILCAILITVIFGEGFGALSAIFCRQLSSLMTKTPAVIDFACQKMVIVSSTYFICGINEVMGGVLRGMRKPLTPAVATFLFMCVLRFIWVYFVFPLYPSLTFLYLVWPIGWIMCIITDWIVYCRTMPKLKAEG